ncbi:hypothetical protein AQUCO_00400066v1 [Aquilegia coerulea]|uniref:DUF223 domain-containing protein n=1 Tax=Aquilegia coerulea TaxID=218851 RepID=A0A2G5ET69_AQUCA|nr:hypothetical protein AQUCO_00400066v1 [Aquilegia coerulea]
MACTDYHYLSEVNDSSERWKVKVRISRKWNVIDFESQEDTLRIDMVLLDEKGDQVHATIPKRQIMKFSTILHEGDVYFLHKFGVSPVKSNYRPVRHPYRVFLKWDTMIKPATNIRPTFPKFKFDFVEYGDIKLRLKDKTYLTDVYGQLTGFTNVKNVESGTLQEIFLKDKSGSNLKVTLWGRAIEQFPDNIVNSSTSCPVVVVTSLTVKLFDGEYSVSSTTATKLYVNLDISEVASLLMDSNEENTVQLIDASSTAITLEERMVNNRKKLVEIVQTVPYAFIVSLLLCFSKKI